MSRQSAGLLIGISALAGALAVAAPLATTTAGTFTTGEIASHHRIVENAVASQPGAAADTTELAKCTARTGSENHCVNGTRVAPKHDTVGSRPGSARQPVDAGAGVTRATYQIDVALYRAHRQLPY